MRKSPMNSAFGSMGVIANGAGIVAELRLPWYRSLPVSTVEIEAVEIDGKPVPHDSVCFELDDIRYQLDEMEEQTGHVWYVLDSGWLHILCNDIAPGQHELAVVLTTYPPYIHGLKRPVRDTCKFLIAQDVPA